MVIPLTGPILFSDIDRELNRDVAITETGLGAAGTELYGRATGVVASISNLRGRGNFIGTQVWLGSTPGLFEFVVPYYRSMYVVVQGGAGGGGAGSTTDTGPMAANGFDGGNAEFRTNIPIIARGGEGGKGGGLGGGTPGRNPTGGSGGLINSNVTASYIFPRLDHPVDSRGAGAPGTVNISGSGGTGGLGSYAARIFNAGFTESPVPGSTIIVSVGQGGQNGDPNLSGFYNGGDSIVSVRWTAKVPGTSSLIYDIPGIYTFLIPDYINSMQVFVSGATGGGGAARSINGSTSPTPGTAGGTTSFAAATPLVVTGSGGGGGGGFGITGQGGTAGLRQPSDSLIAGEFSPANGGSGAIGTNGNGGMGGQRPFGIQKTFISGTAGSPVPGTTIEVRVGAGGQNGDPDLSGAYDGQNGRVEIYW